MSTMSKGQILGGRRDEVMFHTLAVLFTQVGKSERLECVGVFVECIIMVYGSNGCDDRGAFWYKCTARECEVFQRCAWQTR